MKLASVIAVAAMAFALTTGVSAEVRPIAISNGAIGGGPANEYTPGVEGGKGTNNIGLLIRTWGTVRYVDTTNKYFYLDDGAGKLDGSSHVGIRVSYDNLAPGNAITQIPSEGAFVLVTGISSTWESTDGKYWPNIRARHDPDVQILTVK